MNNMKNETLFPAKEEIQKTAISYSIEKHGEDYSIDTVDDFIEGVRYIQEFIKRHNNNL